MHHSSEEPQASPRALDNVRRVMGDVALAAGHGVPEDWVHVARGRDLFVEGWGPFDVNAACAASRQHGGLPSAARVRATGYALKFFGPRNSGDARLLDILAVPDSPMARNLWRFKEFWAGHLSLLGKMQCHFRSMTEDQQRAEALRDPRQVREIREQQRLERALAHFVYPRTFTWLNAIPNVKSGRIVLEVLKTPRRVLEVGLVLGNCCAKRKDAAVYIDKIHHRETALVALLVDGQPMALRELCFQMRVDAGFDAQFCELLRRKGLLARLRANCSLGDWDRLMREVDRVIDDVEGYDACAPSWLELREKDKRPPRLEFRRIFEQAELELRQSLLNAWAAVALQAVQPQFGPWACGPRVAVALGSALLGNTTTLWLDMSGRSVSDEGISAFSEALRTNETLTSLNCAHNDLSDTAAVVLAKAVAVNRGLLDLSLAHNRITQTGAQLLAKGLGHSRSLQLLDLRNNGLPPCVGELDERILV